MTYLGTAEDFLKNYEQHCYYSRLDKLSYEKKLELAKSAIDLLGIPLQNFERLIEQL